MLCPDQRRTALPAALTCCLFSTVLFILLLPGARAIECKVDSLPPWVNTRVSLAPGQAFAVTATGTVDLAATGSSYITGPDGTIVQAPIPYTDTWVWFTEETEPSGVAPFVGQKRYMTSLFQPGCALGPAPIGALVAAFSTRRNPHDLHADFTPWTLVGSSGVVTAPTGLAPIYGLYLGVNDIWYDSRPDNAGYYTATVTAIPEPGTLALLALAATGAIRRRPA